MSKSSVDVAEFAPRKAFTTGWSNSLNTREALPIKTKSGHVQRSFVPVKTPIDKEEESEESEDGIEENGEEEENDEYDYVADFSQVKPDTQAATAPSKVAKRQFNNMRKAQLLIGNICNTIMANPEKALKRKREVDEQGEDIFKMSDLIDMLSNEDSRVAELAMLSAVVLFKDMCPGYRIRPPQEYDSSVTLKKETKKLRDFEYALLGSYQQYLKYLDNKVISGLGESIRTKIVEDEIKSNVKISFAISALRCQCELLRALPLFNFRAQLLTSVVARAAQPCESVCNLCCESMVALFRSDLDGEASFDAVRIVGKVLVSCKYTVPEKFLRCLEHVKLTVHEDEAKNVHKKAKQQRRKRKRAEDDIEIGLEEADVLVDTSKSNSKRFQSDALHEVCLIYFRIVKQKVGFHLLPLALEGLGKITHLINIDTVEDLVILMRGMAVDCKPPPPVGVLVQCIHCALKTLSGPGEELQFDESVFLVALKDILNDLPAEYERWDIILECVDYGFMRRREAQNTMIFSFIKTLICHSCHASVMESSTSSTVLNMAHHMLLRYPRVRSEFMAGLNKLSRKKLLLTQEKNGLGSAFCSVSHGDEEEEVCDLAMQHLKLKKNNKGNSHSLNQLLIEESVATQDVFWLFPLLRHQLDAPRFKKIVHALTAQDINSLPLRIPEAKYNCMKIMDKFDTMVSLLPSKRTAVPKELKGQSNKAHVQSGSLSMEGVGSAAASREGLSKSQQKKLKVAAAKAKGPKKGKGRKGK